jgi:hypothetical protein
MPTEEQVRPARAHIAEWVSRYFSRRVDFGAKMLSIAEWVSTFLTFSNSL